MKLASDIDIHGFIEHSLAIRNLGFGKEMIYAT